MTRRQGPYATTEMYFIRLVGTRGVLLLFLGVMWLLIGIGFILNPMERFSKPGPGGILDFLDRSPLFYVLSGLWIIGGLTAIITAALRPRTCEDGWGFVGVSVPTAIWSTCYWWSWVVSLGSHGDYGRPSAYIAGFIYMTITFMVVFLSRHLQDHPEGPCARRRTSATTE